MTKSRIIIYLLVFVYLILSASLKTVHASFLDTGTIHIGVLAKLGKESCFQQWNPTSTYLKEQLPGFNVQIVCLGFEEFEKAVIDKRVDFTISNPSMYVNLEARYGVSRIATLKNNRSQKAYTRFGGVIFYRADTTDIENVEDLKGKSFMAVAENSFGGWQVSWRYLKERGLSPQQDFKEILFTGRHDAVVLAVANGAVDVGCVRTDTLERMAWEGLIDLDDFGVFDRQETNSDFDFLRTTRLYPEWPLAKVKYTSSELAKQVALAMMQMAPDSPAAMASRSMGWTIPLDYHEVHDCLRLLKISPYVDFGKISLSQLYQQYKIWVYISATFLILTFCGISLVAILNRKLNLAIVDLDSEHQQRAKVVADLGEFKLTLDQTLDCVFMFYADSLRFFYANRGALNHIGYSSRELYTMSPVDIRPDYTESQFRTEIAKLENGSEESLTFITTHQTKDGTMIPVEISLQHIKPPQKEPRFVSIVRDITIRQQQDKEKEHLQSKLLHEQKLASVGQLAAGIAHEINTPAQYLGSNIDFLSEAFRDLSGLMTHFDQLLEATQKQEVSEQLITTVKNSAEEVDWPYLKEEIPQAINQSIDGVKQVSSIVMAMKNFAHPGSTEKELTNLNELLQTTLTVSRNEWKFWVEPLLQLDPNLPLVHCMRNEIGQVFLNLIVNAAHSIKEKHSKNSDGHKGQVVISSTHEESQVVITIADSGSGIIEENLSKIFDPFFTTKEVGTGTGQGLTISYDIITNKHGGTLEATSEEDVGSTFIITLPVNPALQDKVKEGHND